MKEVIQEQSQWCWAAVSRAILYYYGHDVKQCLVAEYTRKVATWHSFGGTDCCYDPSQGCNYWNYYDKVDGSIVDILDYIGSIQSTGLEQPLTEAQADLDLNTHARPFVVRWGMSSGNGHFVVGHALSGGMLSYMNPWPGEGQKVAKFDWVAAGDGHTWTHSVRVTETCRCTAKSGCCDGCDPKNDKGACSDNDLCTTGETCADGTCGGGKSVTCPLSDRCQVAGKCDSATGKCAYDVLHDDELCDDHDACTLTDRCQGGVCKGTRVQCAAPGQCQQAGACAASTGACAYPSLPDGTPCAGGACQAGVCQPLADLGPLDSVPGSDDGPAAAGEGCSVAGARAPLPFPALLLLLLSRRRARRG